MARHIIIIIRAGLPGASGSRVARHIIIIIRAGLPGAPGSRVARHIIIIILSFFQNFLLSFK